MKIALIADLHGNLPAVKALEAHLKTQRPDALWCLGDMVGKGPSSRECYEWAMAHCDLILGGNWDIGIGERNYKRDAYYHEQLGPERLKLLARLPRQHETWMSGRRIRLIHGRPVMEKLLMVQDAKEHLLPFLEPDFNMLVYADSHRQGIRTFHGQIVNIGSVGNALGIPMVQYALLEGEPGRDLAPLEVRMVTLPYDNQQAARDAREAPGLPDAAAYIQEVMTGRYAGNMRIKSKKRTIE